jgi:hypothetical protein
VGTIRVLLPKSNRRGRPPRSSRQRARALGADPMHLAPAALPSFRQLHQLCPSRANSHTLTRTLPRTSRTYLHPHQHQHQHTHARTHARTRTYISCAGWPTPPWPQPRRTGRRARCARAASTSSTRRVPTITGLPRPPAHAGLPARSVSLPVPSPQSSPPHAHPASLPLPSPHHPPTLPPTPPPARLQYALAVKVDLSMAMKGE